LRRPVKSRVASAANAVGFDGRAIGRPGLIVASAVGPPRPNRP